MSFSRDNAFARAKPRRMSTAGNAHRPYVVVANRWAGSGKAHRFVGAVECALGHAAAAIIEPDLTSAFVDRLNGSLDTLGARPDATERPLVVCIGGDGTLSMVFDALQDPRACVLASLPCGSGNDFALALGIGSQAVALDALSAGRARSIDYGTVNGRRFLNCVGIGLDAEVAGMAARIRAQGLAKGFSYYLAALRGLLSVKPASASVSTSDVALRFPDLVMLTVGNGPWYGGGFRGAPDARLDDGVLDCYAFRDVPGVFRRFALMQKIRAGAHPGEPNVASLRTTALRVEFDRPVAMHVDGELSQTQTADVAIVVGGATILAPATSSPIPTNSSCSSSPARA